MPLGRIRAHFEQLSEFERGRIIGLKEAADREDRFIARSAVKAHDSMLTIRHVAHTRVSTMSIYRRIERNLFSCRPLRRLPLKPPHCRAKLQGCLARSSRNHAN
ncbi:hypothetical protein TNCV_4594461 [Trichonephila clavipes]|uniref:Uncharacterized protein n=1 Tax=Trichonephila clavipes TaxID=2585209 RepID=A0A8X6WG31_TRICX|nr:hypothetical protein TNCV_4594461 [Trichonephila clavipes]